SSGEIISGKFGTVGNSTGFKFLISATPVLSKGTSFVKNRMRNIGVVSGGVDQSGDWYDLYSDRFGSTLGTKDNVWFEMRLVATSGQISAPQKIKVTITEGS